MVSVIRLALSQSTCGRDEEKVICYECYMYLSCMYSG